MDAFLKEIRAFLPAERIYTDELRTLAWGTDAGFYRLIPKAVLISRNEADIQGIMRAASHHDVPITFRAAGTSLSGQAITDSVLVVAGKDWEGYHYSNGPVIALQPGILGARVNEITRPAGWYFSPDPASIASAMVGGIVANNASGMNCGTYANSDKILRSMRIIFADGTILDTGNYESCKEFERTHPDLCKEIRAIHDEINSDPEFAKRIVEKYNIKNVTGLNLNPFVRFSEPTTIIAHAMVGSEGTLGFIAEVTVNLLKIKPFTASAMLYFHSMDEATRCVVELKNYGIVDSCEMLDSKSLDAVNDPTGTGLTALLIDTKATDPDELQSNINTIQGLLERFKLAVPPHFSSEPEVTSRWWKLRSGVFPAVGGTRPIGTTTIIEDIAFHIKDLPKATAELVELIKRCGYDDACIYGHALEGNYHFIISQSFEKNEDVQKYRRLMEEVESLVLRYDGSLKAEHGVGRNMAPFIKNEWGDKAWQLMKRIKRAFDPQNILNRGSMFNDDPECHLKNFKPLPQANPIIDKCIECGFCEHNCVSCGLTLSARQRIVIYREITSLRRSGRPQDIARAERLQKAYRYFGSKTCAGDGLCSTSCPMGINTGELIHEVRKEMLSTAGLSVGKMAADHLAGVETGLRLALDAASITRGIIGNKAVNSLGRGLHKVGFPLWTSALPASYKPRLQADQTDKLPRRVVYFPSCINQTMGASHENNSHIEPQVDVITRLCRKAGFEVIFPENMAGLCCGMIWESKGMPEIADKKTAELEAALLKASDNGKNPILCDQSPCLHRMRQHIRGLKLYEPVEFITEHLAPYLEFLPIDEPVAIHITCSSRLMGLAPMMETLARRCSTRVLVPQEIGCCGFAGDKGFTTPELNQWGLRKLRSQIEAFDAQEGFSNSRTCEIGLTTNSGISYKSIAYLVDRVTKPKNNSQ